MGMGVGSGNLSQYLLWALAHQLAKLPSLQLEASSSKLGPKCSCLWSQLGSCSAFSIQRSDCVSTNEGVCPAWAWECTWLKLG